ncbi:hypothetical protein ERJ75_000463000 [Trypanosoma vivax]|nr:hypothetical protein TRVL_06817 [Trypanosoma vivax]KAH8616593.1 hypothetical protein ERJ75_000463000 [Trypanosoma vivax]
MHPDIEALKRRTRMPSLRSRTGNSDVTNKQRRTPSVRSTSVAKQPSPPRRQPEQALKPLEGHTRSSGAGTRLVPSAPPGASTAGRSSTVREKVLSATQGALARHVPMKPLTALRGRPRSSFMELKNTDPKAGIYVSAAVENAPAAPMTDRLANDLESPQSVSRVSRKGVSAPFSDVPQLPSRQDGVHSNERSPRSVKEEEDRNEINTLEYYRTRRRKNLPDHISAFLDGCAMEEPFQTDMWKQTQAGEERRTDGYYACIRCGLPLVLPRFQVPYSIRGIVAFTHLHREGVMVSVGNFGSCVSKGMGSGDLLQLQVRCKGCSGFIGKLVPDPEGEMRNVLVVNSCCLEYVKDRRSHFCLDATFGFDLDNDPAERHKNISSEGPGACMDDSPEEADIDFDDLSIFDL